MRHLALGGSEMQHLAIDSTEEMKPEMMGAVRAVPGFYFDPMSYHPYASGLDGARRKNATRETTAPLKSWLNEHRKNPYPTKAEKIMLALLTKMTLTQVLFDHFSFFA
ncbi:unnamed protein product [Gongylonema pulchrum]|uniref:Homeobox_KN domain-containing protein n=1 Tax=Gongylonema pulchrum TaxID=637853 RepID=A0A183CX88_9BILA|nr:unnamed protein product [Gongylonema pulchrum]